MELPSGPPVAPPSPPVGEPPPPSTAPAPAGSAGGLLSDEDRNRRLVATTAAAALLAVAVMITTFLLTRGDGGDPSTALAPAPTAVDLTPTTVPATPADAGAIEAVVTDIEAFVAAERGLEFLDEVGLEVLDRDAYEERVREEFEAEVADDPEVAASIREAAALYQALGVWPAGVDPIPILREFNAVASLGFYDPVTDEMVVAGGAVTPLLRTTLAHELTHALDDQHVDLDRPELDRRDDESSFAFSAVVEGNARRIESAYEATLSDEDREAAADEAQALIDGIDFSAYPGILVLEQQFVYETGEAFVEALFEAGGNAEVDRALRRPPTTSEQIQEPEGWLEGEQAPAPVEVPEADGDPVADGVLGQFLLDQLTTLDRPEGETVPEWDGDRYVVWEDGEQACARATVRGDAEGFADALAGWAAQVGAELDVQGDELVIESCG